MSHAVVLLSNTDKARMKWVRSSAECQIQEKQSKQMRDMFLIYMKNLKEMRSKDEDDASIERFDFVLLAQGEQFEKEKYNGKVIINLCTGIELDGFSGPSVTIFMEENNISFVGSPSRFLLKTISKESLREILKKTNYPTLPFQMFSNPEKSTLPFPLVVNPADSYIKKNFIAENEDQLQTFLLALLTNFTCVITEPWVDHNTYYVLINYAFSQCIPEDKIEAISLARSCYFYLEGGGPAIIEIGHDQKKDKWFAKDVRVSGVYSEIIDLFGFEKAVHMLHLHVSHHLIIKKYSYLMAEFLMLLNNYDDPT